VLEKFIPLQAEMLENSITLCLILGQSHEGIGLFKILSAQILARFAVETLRQLDITHVPPVEGLLHVGLHPLDPVVGEDEPVTHDLSESDNHLPVVPNFHLELVVIVGEGLPTTDSFVDFGDFLLVDILFRLFNILWSVSFTVHELQEISIQSFSLKNMLSNWANLIELLNL
jgi:hypothetical protein